MAHLLWDTTTLPKRCELMAGKAGQRCNRLRTRLVHHKPERKLVASAVAQNRVHLSGIHHRHTLPLSVVPVKPELVPKIIRNARFSLPRGGVDL